MPIRVLELGTSIPQQWPPLPWGTLITFAREEDPQVASRGPLYSTAEDAGGGDRENARHWGETIYSITTIVSVLIAALAITTSLYDVSESEPVVPVAALLLAATIWLIGRSCRYLLT